jgi:hypothetical protein
MVILRFPVVDEPNRLLGMVALPTTCRYRQGTYESFLRKSALHQNTNRSTSCIFRALLGKLPDQSWNVELLGSRKDRVVVWDVSRTELTYPGVYCG